MSWDAVLQRFIDQAPACVMARAALEHVFARDRLDDLFERHAGAQHTRELTFSAVVGLMAQVVFRIRPSVRDAARAAADVAVSLTSVYNKLNGLEPGLSEALVRETAARPDPVPGLRLRTVDGNYLAGTDRRLRELRGSGAAALPGMALVVRDDRTGLLTELLAREDAYASERGQLAGVLALVEPGDLWLADRNFCTAEFPPAVAGRGAFFLIRHHKALHLHPAGAERFVGTTATGDGYERPARLAADPAAAAYRCLRVALVEPTRDGDRELVVLTNVPADQAGAPALAELYRRRWSIETAFQELTARLRCEVETLGYPRAALFAFAVAVTAYNVLALVRGALAAAHGRAWAEAELSGHALARELAHGYGGMAIALPPAAWARFRGLGAAALAAALRGLAGRVPRERYRKAKRGPKKPVALRRTRRGAHRSTARLIQQRKESHE
jgi:IS4 transposase